MTSPDMRSPEERLYDAIFETPQSVIDARNDGHAHAWAEPGAEPKFSTFDTSPEASAFWDGCHAAIRRANALADAIGPVDGEDIARVGAVMSTTEPNDEMEAAEREWFESFYCSHLPMKYVPGVGVPCECGDSAGESYAEHLARVFAQARLRAALAVASAPSDDDREALNRAWNEGWEACEGEHLRGSLTVEQRGNPYAVARRSPVSPPEDVTELLAEADEFTQGWERESGARAWRPFDQAERIPHWGEPRTSITDQENDRRHRAIQAWEEVHHHDVRLKCYPEFGCSVIESYAADLVLRLVAALRVPVPVETRNPRELVCDDCGRDYPIWFAPNDVWNLGGGERGGFECPSCFATKYEAWAGSPVRWSFAPDVPVQTVTTEDEACALDDGTVYVDRNNDVFVKVGARAFELAGHAGHLGPSWIAYPARVFRPTREEEHPWHLTSQPTRQEGGNG